MNWWSAFTWCESIGGHLASFASMCPGVQTNTNGNSGACPNLAKVFGSAHRAWSNVGWKTNTALNVCLSDGSINDVYGPADRRGGKSYAFCEE